MELSNLINNKPQHHIPHNQHHPHIVTAPPAVSPSTQYHYNHFPEQQQQQQQQQQESKLPIVTAPQPIQQHQSSSQHIKLPSIHEIINISELNYQIANPKPQYYTPALNSNSNYNYQQPQPQSATSSPFLYSNANANNSNNNNNNITNNNSNNTVPAINTNRSSPVNSIIHSPIESPIYQRSASSSSSLSDQNSSSSSSDSNYTNKIGIISRSQNGRKGRSNLPKKTTMILLDWLYKNINHPYPNPKQKSELIYQTGLSSQQLSNWFINARRRKIRSLKFQEDEKYIL